MNRTLPFSLSCIALGMLMLGVSGCTPSGPKLHRIKGTATYKGKPLSKLYVAFVPDDQMTKATATAVTDENGKFELMLGSTPGCYPGPHTVTLNDPLAAVGGKSSSDPGYLEVTKKYGFNSPLKINIEKDDLDYKLEL